MAIERVIIKNYRVLKDVDIKFNENLNIIVGNNECGKSTLIEAINLALSGQINNRYIQYELHPFLFNIDAINDYINNIKTGVRAQPPKIFIEIYFKKDDSLAILRGINNSLKEDTPGVCFAIELDDNYRAEFAKYVKDSEKLQTIPIEYYAIKWNSFAFSGVSSRNIPIKPTLIDASAVKHGPAAGKYVLEIIKDNLSSEEQSQLSLSYRNMKDLFMKDHAIEKINKKLSFGKGSISNKKLSISLDTTSRANWENSIMPQLNEIPLPLVGKGEQSSLKINLAIESTTDSHLYLIEEPENHLSFSNLHPLIKMISEKSSDKQLIITTHSSFVLNKLGIENVILFNNNKNMTLRELDPDTHDYFMKLPGHDTLRLILAKKAILVEGPSDELIVQKAFLKKHHCTSLEKSCDIISVQSLAFKRFLKISAILNICTTVITDNDGHYQKIKDKYKDFLDYDFIKICVDDDDACTTLEPQLFKANDLEKLNSIFEKNFDNKEELLSYMSNNKTDCALKIFNSKTDINFPVYIDDAVHE